MSQVWCKHISFLHGQWFYKSNINSYGHIKRILQYVFDWEFCPICGTPKPTPAREESDNE